MQSSVKTERILHNMKNKKKKDDTDGIVYELCFCLFGTALIHVLLAGVSRIHGAPTYVGREGLLAVRQTILLFLLSRICIMFAPLLCLLISGFVVHLFRHKKLRPSRKRLLTGLVLCLPMCLFAASHRNGFEVQCGQNGCRGFRSMQLLHLLSDVQKDLHEAEAPNVLTVSAERKYRYEQYRRSSRGHANRIKLTKYREDYLQFSGGADCTAQITHADYQRAAGICTFAEHQIALYPHSGFIQSFDGGALPELHDCETLFTLTYSYEDNMLRRTVHPREMQMRSLTLVEERCGEIVCQIAAEKTTEQWMDAGLNTRVWLEMLYEGQTVRVSNILEF